MKTNMIFETSPDKHREGRRYSGFTLLEALIATAVVGISFVSLYSGLEQGVNIVQGSGENLRATQIMGEKMETIRLYTWRQLTNSSYIPRAFTNYYNPPGLTNGTQGATYYGTLTITNTSLTELYNTELREVTVTVNWSSGSRQLQEQMTTFVSQHGMQNYIYQ